MWRTLRRRHVEDLEETTIRAGKPQGLILQGKQASDGPEGTPMQTLAARLGIGQLPERFFQYLRLNTPEPVNLEGVAHFPMHYYAELSVKVRRKWWSEYSRGDLDGKIVGKLGGLSAVRGSSRPVNEIVLMVTRGRVVPATKQEGGKYGGCGKARTKGDRTKSKRYAQGPLEGCSGSQDVETVMPLETRCVSTIGRMSPGVSWRHWETLGDI
ncbi:hypothetical protein BGX38DRAFT_1144757 [Terfezia claveryi]|nr:hypothetical protein BGX38DRAFT_1144757 [Terfezia claveryi]